LANKSIITPFKASSKKVATPSFLPKTLLTLVAPIFFEPKFRISVEAKIFAKSNPKGTLPSK
jgi:hypothetical protein